MVDWNFGEQGMWRALRHFVANVAIACCSMDVLAEVDGWRFSLTPLAIWEVSAWALLWFTLISFELGAAILLVTAIILKFARKDISTWIPRVLSWVAQVVVALVILRMVHYWSTATKLLPVAPFSLTAKLAIAAFIISGIGFRTLIKCRPDPEILQLMPRFAMLLLVVTAPAIAYSIWETGRKR